MESHDKPHLLIVDDDPLITGTLHFVLSRDFEVRVAESRSQARSVIRQLDTSLQLALVDLGLPPTPHRPDEGYKLIAELIASFPLIKIFVLSGQSDESHARHARTLGAVEFIAKPCEPTVIKEMLLQALAVERAEISEPTEKRGLLGRSLPIEKLRQQITQYANAPFPVLIEGESGSGKELVAEALHRDSQRGARRLFALNCAAISPTLVEPTLFGYSKGAFTGATNARAGYFEDAQDSTLFLDEIGELPMELQAKLLRVLENGEFQRIGETQSRKSNARVIAATNRDLRSEVRHGGFRADLYHRLSVFTISVPPLRDLGEDKRLLLDHYRFFYAHQAAVQPFELDPEAMDSWMRYPFPGNVRELRNIVIRLTTKYSAQKVRTQMLEAELDITGTSAQFTGIIGDYDPQAAFEAAKKHLQTEKNFNLDLTLQRWEKSYVEAALAVTEGNLSQAAKLLGIQRTTLYSRMRNFDSSRTAHSRSIGTSARENF